jgi:hypothetical protein
VEELDPLSIPLRDVTLKIGKRQYNLKTALDEETYRRVLSLLNEAANTIGTEVAQEHLLLLVSLHLAYCLDRVGVSLQEVLREAEGDSVSS